MVNYGILFCGVKLVDMLVNMAMSAFGMAVEIRWQETILSEEPDGFRGLWKFLYWIMIITNILDSRIPYNHQPTGVEQPLLRLFQGFWYHS